MCLKNLNIINAKSKNTSPILSKGNLTIINSNFSKNYINLVNKDFSYEYACINSNNNLKIVNSKFTDNNVYFDESS